MDSEEELLNRLQDSLSKSKYKVMRKGRDQGYDILLEGPDGKKVVIEIKNKVTPIDSVDVAQVYSAKQKIKADQALLVSPAVSTTSASESGKRTGVRILKPNEVADYLGYTE